MKRWNKVVRGCGAGILSVALLCSVGCQRDAGDEVGDALENAGDATMDAADEAGDNVRDAVN